MASVNFTRNYLNTVETQLEKSQNSDALIAAMKSTYPYLKDKSALELSAKVLKGEMKWPQ